MRLLVPFYTNSDFISVCSGMKFFARAIRALAALEKKKNLSSDDIWLNNVMFLHGLDHIMLLHFLGRRPKVLFQIYLIYSDVLYNPGSAAEIKTSFVFYSGKPCQRWRRAWGSGCTAGSRSRSFATSPSSITRGCRAWRPASTQTTAGWWCRESRCLRTPSQGEWMTWTRTRLPSFHLSRVSKTAEGFDAF